MDDPYKPQNVVYEWVDFSQFSKFEPNLAQIKKNK